MESTVRSPQTGDMVIVLAKMKSGRFTELSGLIEDISAGYAYFGLDSINVCENLADDDGRLGVPLDE